MLPYTKESYQLMHDGARALAVVEAAGMRVDVPYLERAWERTKRRIKRLERRLESSEVMREWRKAFGKKTNINSGPQLGRVLFDVMGFDPPESTASGKHKTDETSLGKVDHPFVRDYLQIKKLQKAQGTYLQGLLREVHEGFIHPFFNLHLAKTYRGSCDHPNFQNIPIRDPEIGRLIRKAFIARVGRQLVEIDCSGQEVRVAACYHKDPTMLEYIHDPTKDMHRDMAMECYLISQQEVTKPIRYCGKNMFVFPQFYGDWYIDCARSLWDAIGKMKLETVSGVPLYDHLKEYADITELGDLDPKEKPRPHTFERHIQQVESRFWKKRFPIYAKWKNKWYENYRERGWFQMFTGFICQGHMKRNKAINYPVQGAAFHCLLWSLNRIVLEELKKRKMATVIIGQIHDSIVADVPPHELDEFLSLAQEVMTVRLPKEWPWIIVPLEIEAEVSPVGGTWADKEERKIA